jgi:N6-L-threonylcarbamoyladenine synthase
MKILGIETSCDETGAAVVEASGKDKKVILLSNVLATSLAMHAETGGIIPEVAARQQVKSIIPVIQKALKESGVTSENEPPVDAIAVTFGPGLIGSLLVGIETAKTLSLLWNVPIIPVNHMYGHIYANWIIANSESQIDSTRTISSSPLSIINFPAIALVISGGHTDIVLLKEHGDLTVIGGTRDDAAGECFDKCARLLGYAYPGGPKISQLAQKGNPKAFPLPRPMIGSHDYDFSFSGLKTAFMRLTKELLPLERKELEHIKGGWQQVPLENTLSDSQKQTLYDLCASLEYAIADIVTRKVMKALGAYTANTLVVSGGVAANKVLINMFHEKINKSQLDVALVVPPGYLCTDNAAMIAAAGFYNNKQVSWEDVTADPELYY